MKDLDFIVALLTKDNVVSEINGELDRLLAIIPELKQMIGFEHCNPHHHLNVWEHTLLALKHSDDQLTVRLALLLHDIGKPYSYQQDGEIRHYRGHADKSADMAKKILDRLGFDKEFCDSVTEIVRRHDTPLTQNDIAASPHISRLIFDVQRCDALAHNPRYNRHRIAYINRIIKLINQEDIDSGST